MDFDYNAVMKCFLAETEEGLSAMEQALLHLEDHPDDSDSLHVIFRMAHNLKGNAAALDLTAISGLAHTLEDHLGKLRSGEITITPDMVTILLRAVDALRGLVSGPVPGKVEVPAEVSALFEQISQKPKKKSPAKTRKDPAPENGKAPSEHKVPAHLATLRVDIDKLDRLVNLAGEIAIARGRLGSALQRAHESEGILDVHRETDLLYAELQEIVMRLRMVPLGPSFAQFARVARDVARSSGKLVRFTTSGEDVELDARVIEMIHDPLVHLIRNAVDHGIEPPAIRRAKGKDEYGAVGLHARHEGGNVIIQVTDDGAGLDCEQIRKRALQLHMISEGDHLTEQDIYRFVFEPGFSTAAEVTELSGRGVGMDIVRRNVEALRGSVSVDSRLGNSCAISMRIPLTLAIIEGFAVRVSGETYVVPLDSVLECFELPKEWQPGRSGGVVQLRDEPLAFIRLRSVFACDGPGATREHIVVVHHESGRLGLAVDSLEGEIQAVVKPLGKTFALATEFSGSTILGDGRVALLLDVSRLAQQIIRPQIRTGGIEGEELKHWNEA